MNESEIFPIKNIDKILQANPTPPEFILSDVLLILLYADKDNPLVGKIRQMKEVFLTLMELQALKAESVQFKMNRYGPYSTEVVETIDNLLFTNYITSSGTKNQTGFGIQITKKGALRIGSIFEKLPEKTKNLLRNKRNEWDTLTRDGIMRYVYTHYPEYLGKSVLKNRYAVINWDDKDPGDQF